LTELREFLLTILLAHVERVHHGLVIVQIENLLQSHGEGIAVLALRGGSLCTANLILCAQARFESGL
jgi:hypothetical protein